MSLLIYLACFGHIFVHCKQEIHLLLSTAYSFDGKMASTGHLFAHAPHLLHILFTLGLIGIERYLRYVTFPGILAVVVAYGNKLLHLLANSFNCFISAESGLPIPYLGITECCVTAAMPAIHKKPAPSNVFFNSIKASSNALFPLHHYNTFHTYYLPHFK